MTTAQFQSYHIERHLWLTALVTYAGMYHAYYSDWRPASKLIIKH